MPTDLHWEMPSGRTAGAPWCRSDPSVAAQDMQSAITTADEDAVTCAVCCAHLDSVNEVRGAARAP